MGKTADPQTVSDLRNKVMGQLQYINDSYFQANENHIVGNTLSIADIALGTAVFWLSNFIAPDQLGWAWSKFPKIDNWWRAIQNTDHFRRAHFDTLSTLAVVRGGSNSNPASPTMNQAPATLTASALYTNQPAQNQPSQPIQTTSTTTQPQVQNTQTSNVSQNNTTDTNQTTSQPTQTVSQPTQTSNNNVGLQQPASSSNQDKGKQRVGDGGDPLQSAEDEIQAEVGKRIPIIINENTFDKDPNSNSRHPLKALSGFFLPQAIGKALVSNLYSLWRKKTN